MRSSRRRRAALLVAMVAVVVVGLSLSLEPSAPASATIVDPITTDVSQYALNVTSSVLEGATEGAGTGTITAGQLGGLLANGNQFDPDWLMTEAGQAYGGTTNATPPDIDNFSSDEQEVINEMENQFAGAPATDLADEALTKAPGVLGGDVVPIVGAAEAGVMLGAKADELIGVDVNGGLCTGAPNFGYAAANAILAALTSTDCESWNEAQEAIQKANQDMQPTVTEDANGSQSCVDGHCAQITSVSDDGTSFCIESSDPYFASTNPLSEYSALSSYQFAGANYSTDAPGDGLVCPMPPAGEYEAFISVRINNTWMFPLTTWQASWGATETPVPAPTLTFPNPSRNVQCNLTLLNGQVLTTATAAYNEVNATNAIPRPDMPAIPFGDVPINTQCFELGGTQPVQIFNSSITAQFQAFAQNFPECMNGSCLLDLLSNGTSCLFANIGCDGWVQDPNRDSTYSCEFGTHEVPLSDCYIYGTTFNPDDRSSGHAYADPATGQLTDGQTSPSDVDTLESYYLNHAQWVTGGEFEPLTDSEKAEIAREVAEECLAEATVPFQGTQQVGELTVVQLTAPDCKKRSIFAPGGDVAEATVHDGEAIYAGQASVLHYESPDDKNSGPNALPQGWYNRVAYDNCGDNYNPPTTNCDEYPYYSTMEGGPGASLKNIDAGDNQKEGRMLGYFYAACGVNAVTPEYTVTPQLAETDDFEAAETPTVGICIEP